MSEVILFFAKQKFLKFEVPTTIGTAFKPWLLSSRKLPAFMRLSRMLSLAAGRVYECLIEHGNNESGLSWPAIDRIAFLCGLSTSAVEEALRQLRAKGYIRPVRVPAAPQEEKEKEKKKRPSTRYAFVYNHLWDKAVRYQASCIKEGQAKSGEEIDLLVDLLEDRDKDMGDLREEARCWRRVYRCQAADTTVQGILPEMQGEATPDVCPETREEISPESREEISPENGEEYQYGVTDETAMRERYDYVIHHWEIRDGRDVTPTDEQALLPAVADSSAERVCNLIDYWLHRNPALSLAMIISSRRQYDSDWQQYCNKHPSLTADEQTHPEWFGAWWYTWG